MRLLAIVILLAFAPVSGHTMDACKGLPKPQPQVSIKPALPDIVETRERSYRSFAPAGALGHHVLGMSVTRDKIQYIPRIEYVRQGNHVCAHIADVDMIFGFETREILIAREAQPGSCLYREVRDHEYKHAAADARSVREYLPYLGEKLGEAARAHAVIRARSAEDAARLAAERIMAAMRPAVTHVIERRAAMQRRIDTPEEYGRISSICRVDIRNFIR